MYGRARAEGGTGTPGITGGCRCPGFGTPRSKMPDGPIGEIELEIDQARLNVQHALDHLCAVVKRHMLERRDGTNIDPNVVLGRMPAILKDPPKRTQTSNGAHAPKPKALDMDAPTLGPCHRKILTVLAQHGPKTTHQIAIHAGYSESGSFNGALTDLRGLEFITRGIPVVLTDRGRAELGQVPALPKKGRPLLDYWLAKCNPCEQAILEALSSSGSMTSFEIAEATDYSESGSFNAALTRLRALGLILHGQPIALAKELRA